MIEVTRTDDGRAELLNPDLIVSVSPSIGGAIVRLLSGRTPVVVNVQESMRDIADLIAASRRAGGAYARINANGDVERV